MTESELCSKFMEYVRNLGWRAHPECCDWDIVLEKDGLQVGVQAKMHMNYKVLGQACPYWGHWPGNRIRGPEYRTVLVPKSNTDFSKLANSLHLLVFDWDLRLKEETKFRRKFWLLELRRDHFLWKHKFRLQLPPVEFDIPAGTPSPIRVTPWKIAAVKLSLRIREQGYLTTLDFKEFGITLVPNTWEPLLHVQDKINIIKPGSKRSGSYNKWCLREGAILFDQQFPYITKVIDKL